MANFCQLTGIIDKDFITSTAERLYIASTVRILSEKYEEKKRQQKPRGDNPDSLTQMNDMLRTEFLEFILRVIKLKYVESGIESNYVLALNHFFDTHISRFSTMYAN